MQENRKLIDLFHITSASGFMRRVICHNSLWGKKSAVINSDIAVSSGSNGSAEECHGLLLTWLTVSMLKCQLQRWLLVIGDFLPWGTSRLSIHPRLLICFALALCTNGEVPTVNSPQVNDLLCTSFVYKWRRDCATMTFRCCYSY